MFAVNRIVDFKIRSGLIAPEKEVVAYYEAHPEMLEPSYQIRRAVIPFSSAQTKML
jgi:hypothetical protein